MASQQLPPRAPQFMNDPNSWRDFQLMVQQPPLSTSMSMDQTPNQQMIMELTSTGNIVEYSSNQQQQQQQLSSSSPPPWMMDDEFVAFSSARRKAQRKMINDFLEDDKQDELQLCHVNELNNCRGGGGDIGNCSRSGEDANRFDDDQLLSLFNNEELVINGESSSSPARCDGLQYNNRRLEHQQINRTPEEEKKVRFESEVVENYSFRENGRDDDGDDDNRESEHGAEEAGIKTISDGSEETVIDPKRVKRILANRQSAQRSRVRKLQYITDLERSVTTLQAEVSTLSPRVAFLDHQRMLLSVDNSTLKSKIAALAHDKMFKDAHQNALRKEIERLKQVYYHKSLKASAANGDNNNNMETNSSLQPFTMALSHQPPYCEQYIH